MASDFLPNSELIITDEPNKNTVDVETIDNKLRRKFRSSVKSIINPKSRLGSAIKNFTCRTLTCPDLIFAKAYK